MRFAPPSMFVLAIATWLVALAPAPLPAQPETTINQPMTLTDAQVGGFFDAMDEIRAKVPASASADDAGKPTRPEAFARAIEVSGESMAILRKHGFHDSTSFQRVGYNVAMAYSVVKEGGKDAVNARMDDARTKQAAAMEKMRAHLSPEQAKVIEAQANAGMAQGNQMRDVPDENVELMKKYRDRMEKLRARR